MRHLARSWLLVVVGACSHGPPAATQQTPPAKPTSPDAACAEVARFHRETVARGAPQVIARDGATATYRGQTIDDYDDGRSEVILDLELAGQPWLPDARDAGVHAFGDHCIRLVSAERDRVVLDVALQPAHQYDAWRCEMGCCAPGASRAPDGTEECCFCADDPPP